MEGVSSARKLTTSPPANGKICKNNIVVDDDNDDNTTKLRELQYDARSITRRFLVVQSLVILDFLSKRDCCLGVSRTLPGLVSFLFGHLWLNSKLLFVPSKSSDDLNWELHYNEELLLTVRLHYFHANSPFQDSQEED